MPPTPPPPNILYIMADDHAAHAISAYGSKINKTPNIDRIAKEGMRFNQLFRHQFDLHAQPGRILTGKYSHINGVPVFNRIRRQPADAGQVSAEGRLSHRHDRQMASRQRSDRLRLLEHPARPGRLSRSGLHRRWAAGKSTRATATDLITDFSLDFLKKRPKDKPFFLMCHHKAPHRPWEPDEKHAKMFENVRDPRAGDVQRRLRGPLRRRPRSHHADRPRSDAAATKSEAAGGPDRQGTEEVEIPALHARLSGLRRHPSTTTSAGCSTISTRTAWRRTPSSSTPPTRASSSAITTGSTSASCTRNRCGCRSWFAGRARSSRARSTTDDPERRFRADAAGRRRRESAGRHARPQLPAAAARARRRRTGGRRCTTATTIIRCTTASSRTTASAPSATS